MFPVYPETRGVPLEEMDAVFGEGMFIYWGEGERGSDLDIDEREEALENDSERASLVSNSRSSLSRSSRRKAGAASEGWVSRLMGRSEGRANYQPIGDGDE